MSSTIIEVRLFLTNSSDVRVTLPMMLRPSRTMSGSDSRFSSSSTSCAALRPASHPCAMATLQSAVWNAATSFTPSPTMPTQRPAARSAATIFAFCAAVAEANTPAYAVAAASASSESPAQSTSGPSRCSARAMAAAASGVSPVSRRTSTPSARKYATVSRASPRSTSAAVPHVSVPVLSKQSVSIRPNISTLYKSRASTCRRLSTAVDSSMAAADSSSSAAGSMPIRN